ncbi:MAG: prepilin-type N-terminal cleavage/methylation domain-containing protein [Myxococcota bacterium]
MMTRAMQRQGGLTLVEVMLALAILSAALVGLLGETALNVRSSQEAMMRGVVVELIRSKVYDIEAELLKDGFQELDQSDSGDFSDEGWPDIEWKSEVEKVELPGLNTLQELGEEGQGGEDGATDSPLGGVLDFAGLGLGGGDAQGAEMITQQFETISKVLEASIRKVTVTVTWTVGNETQEMVVACYFTDPKSMDKVLSGAGRDSGESEGGGSSGGTGTTSGSSTRPPTPGSTTR